MPNQWLVSTISKKPLTAEDRQLLGDFHLLNPHRALSVAPTGGFRLETP